MDREHHPARENMFAVIKTGGKQYRVAANDLVKIEKLEAEAGQIVTFDQVLMVGDESGTTVGAPLVAGALVAAEFLSTDKQDTVIILKKHRRQHFDRRNGHRQKLSTVRITEILTGGAQPTMAARTSRPAKAAAAAEATTEAPKPSLKKAAAKSEAGFTDDITLIGGIGAALEKKLNAAGVTSLNDIAGWSDDDVARYDAELSLRGRITRDEWIAQAKDLIAGKPPRAKIDQAQLADKE
jgi:large subunit ribosomal protein L21